jgi:hypothetical protein
MVYGNNSEGCEWVAFENGQANGESGFEAIADNARSRRGVSAKRRSKGSKNDSNASVATWMKQPINSDASWAPVAPPNAKILRTEPPTAGKRRPPRQEREVSNARTPSSNAQETNSTRRQNLNGPNPVSSDSSASSSADRAASSSRGRSVERRQSPQSFERKPPKNESRRGRSRTRGVTEITSAVQPPRQFSRGRSTSQSRTGTLDRERSTSASRRSSPTTPTAAELRRGRSGSRPPPTSGNHRQRSRSDSRTPVTRARSTSRTKPTGNRPPPSTSRTRREMNTRPVDSGSNSVGPGVPKRSSTSVSGEVNDHVSLRSTDGNIGRDISFGRTKSGRALTPTVAGGKRSGFMEKLFGDQVSEEAKQAYLPRAEPSPTASVSSVVSWQQPEQIHSRILLTATVYHNTATNLWIATINTNQKGVAKNPATASKYLKAFSFSSEQAARESAIANAPPKMISFQESPNCFICKGKFAMFRRAGHCRNCGVCVCNSCSAMWPAKMLPETYNLKKESQLKICKSCNFLSSAFKKALLTGDYEEAVALYGSGNINLRTPFPQPAKKKEEVMCPIHGAVEGGNLEIVRWLMDDHFCSIKVVRTGSGKKLKRGGSADQPILTSKGRSVLSIAVGGLHVDILRYLVVDCGVSIYESKDLRSSLRVLEAVLLALPESSGENRGEITVARWDDASFDENGSMTSSLGGDQTLADEDGAATVESKNTRNADSVSL